MTTANTPLNNPRLGIALLIGFCIFAPASDALVKLLGDGVPLLQVLIARFVLLLILVRPRLWKARRDLWLRADRFGWIVLRSQLHLGAIACFFLSLRYLPLADALAIAYVMPFIVLGVGWAKGEPAPPLRLTLCFIGFVGTLMVVQPSFAAVGWPALLPVAVAVLFTGFMFITRRISADVQTVDLQAMHGVIMVSILIPLALFGQFTSAQAIQIIAVSPSQLLWLFGVGALGMVAHLMMNFALRNASPPTIAPIQYLEISFGALYGWALFGDLPNGIAATGIFITVVAGLAVLAIAPKAAPN